jgi:hypothetical protein
MSVSDIYRQYAAECVSMSQRRENVNDKALPLQMATMWLNLAEFAERKKDKANAMRPRLEVIRVQRARANQP